MSDMPTNDEIRAAAERLGIANPDGTIPNDALTRNRLFAAVQIAKRETAAEADPSNRTTVDTLAAFDRDLKDQVGYDEEADANVRDLLIAELLRHLLRTEGLKLSTDTKEPRP
ncbi:hypothetical protein CH278_02125 [Rhodococcus sp. 05-2254-5]|jgi:hypothetical protein|uniref:hypothetical protein n=1 Tax=unclassified Rhodococcus (in: high G+C Gram-positive bacteria) TaxID=192944 RepID=UPI000B9AC6CC|nr:MULTISPECIES: hypothetical protein [unclassified Rhodococcus (in: high G+C Gram-positive bacteria)]OZE39102.1 hypothetical protein CH278_02125 [Rhodococcus sp. 05-2254-5]OZE59043.1 hypothetical protein CH269_08620 [Rhodococcus sp. 05-2254-1]